MDSIASRLAFDREKLLWELDFFFKHFMTGLRKLKFSSDDEASLRSELDEIAITAMNAGDAVIFLPARAIFGGNLMRLHLVVR